MVEKLSQAQQKLLTLLDEECSEEGYWMECESKEWRTAKALERKGIIEVKGDKGHFEIRRVVEEKIETVPEVLTEILSNVQMISVPGKNVRMNISKIQNKWVIVAYRGPAFYYNHAMKKWDISLNVKPTSEHFFDDLEKVFVTAKGLEF